MQAFLRTDAGEIADRVRPGIAHRSRAAMAGQVETRVNNMDPFTRNVEIAGHEIGIVEARGNEAVHLTAMLPDQVETLAAMRLGQGFEINIIALECSENGYVEPALDLVHQS